jgi:hypothetical protein
MGPIWADPGLQDVPGPEDSGVLGMFERFAEGGLSRRDRPRQQNDSLGHLWPRSHFGSAPGLRKSDYPDPFESVRPLSIRNGATVMEENAVHWTPGNAEARKMSPARASTLHVLVKSTPAARAAPRFHPDLELEVVGFGEWVHVRPCSILPSVS